MKYISVATSYSIYQVPDETFQVLSSGAMTTPPYLVLEVMVMNGDAKKVGSVGSTVVGEDGFDVDGEEDEESPWVEDQPDD